MSYRIGVYRVPSLGMWLLVLAITALCFRLSVWQWHRAEYKQSLLTRQASESERVAPFAAGMLVSPFQQLQVKGQYQAQQWWLDNRFYHHQPGFEVLAIYRVSKDKAMLVDRGWVAADPHTRVPAHLPPLTATTGTRGQAYYPSHQWRLGPPYVVDKGGQVPIIEYLAMTELSSVLSPFSLYPFVLRLSADDVNALPREWPVVTMTPSQHRGYAFQWLAFGLTALIIFFTLGFKRVKKTNGHSSEGAQHA